MGKTMRKLGLGLILGGLSAHYLSTPKGKQLSQQVLALLADVKDQPDHYQAKVKDLLTSLRAGQTSQDLKEAFSKFKTDATVIEGEFTEPPADVAVDDIIIDYDQD